MKIPTMVIGFATGQAEASALAAYFLLYVIVAGFIMVAWIQKGFFSFLGSLQLPYCGDVSNWPQAFDGQRKILFLLQTLYYVTFCLNIVF